MYKANKKYLEFINSKKIQELIDKTEDLDYWGFIPIDYSFLDEQSSILKSYKSIIDLGCGPGNVLRYFRTLGFTNITGVEKNKEFKNYLTDFNILFQDINNIDFSIIKDYDVIYSYKPLKSDFKDFIDNIIDNMKTGSYILTPKFKINNDKVELINNYLYKKL